MVNTRSMKEGGETSSRGRGGSRGRPRRSGRVGRPSSEFVPDEVGSEAPYEQMQESVSRTRESVEPPYVSAQGPSVFDLVGMITQAVVAAVGASSSSQSRGWEAERNVERARKLGALEFQGSTDPILAGNWLQKTERVFDVMKCSEDQRLSIASFLLEGRAQGWWRSVCSRQPRGVELSWGDFKREFHRQYYSEVYKDQKRKEFLRLTQGKMSVAEYEAMFIELSQFAEAHVADERKRCRLFQDGLNLAIKAKVGMQNYSSYAELV